MVEAYLHQVTRRAQRAEIIAKAWRDYHAGLIDLAALQATIAAMRPRI